MTQFGFSDTGMAFLSAYLEGLHDVEGGARVEARADAVHKERRLGPAQHLT